MMRGAHGPVRGIVESVEDLSPTFRRITFSGPELHALATEGPFYDQRIKLILPNAAGALPRIPSQKTGINSGWPYRMMSAESCAPIRSGT